MDLTPPDVMGELLAVHREVEAAMGRLCLTTVRRRLRPEEVAAWAGVLAAGAARLERLSRHLTTEKEDTRC